MTFEEFKEKVDAVYSKITPDELIAELEELGYPLECFEEEPREKYPFYVHFVKECFEEELSFSFSENQCACNCFSFSEKLHSNIYGQRGI